MVYLRTLTKPEKALCHHRSGIEVDRSLYKGPGLYHDETGYWAVYSCGPFGIRKFYLVIKNGKV